MRGVAPTLTRGDGLRGRRHSATATTPNRGGLVAASRPYGDERLGYPTQNGPTRTIARHPVGGDGGGDPFCGCGAPGSRVRRDRHLRDRDREGLHAGRDGEADSMDLVGSAPRRLRAQGSHTGGSSRTDSERRRRRGRLLASPRDFDSTLAGSSQGWRVHLRECRRAQFLAMGAAVGIFITMDGRRARASAHARRQFRGGGELLQQRATQAAGRRWLTRAADSTDFVWTGTTGRPFADDRGRTTKRFGTLGRTSSVRGGSPRD